MALFLTHCNSDHHSVVDCTFDMNVLHGLFHSITLAHLGINACLVSRATSAGFEKTVGIGPVSTLSKPLIVHPIDYVLSPIGRI
jgi:hypothetical protein